MWQVSSKPVTQYDELDVDVRNFQKSESLDDAIDTNDFNLFTNTREILKERGIAFAGVVLSHHRDYKSIIPDRFYTYRIYFPDAQTKLVALLTI